MNREDLQKIAYEVKEGFRAAGKVVDVINEGHNIVYLVGVRKALALACQSLDRVIDMERSDPVISQYIDVADMIANKICSCALYVYKDERQEADK